MKRLIVSCAVGLGMVLSGASMASAGEYNGNGQYIPAPTHAASECAYSGLDIADAIEGNPPGFNDDALAVRGNQSPAGMDRYHGVQTYGTYVRAGLKAMVPSPGTACNGR